MNRGAATAETLADLPAVPSLRIERFAYRNLVHSKGQFAGQKFVFEPWQQAEIVRPVYDSLVWDGDALIREISESLIGVGKKNGKSHVGAVLGAYGLFADGYWCWDPEGGRAGHDPERDGPWWWQLEYGAEVYNVAASKDQARVLFAIAKSFVERSPNLRALTAGRIYRDAIEFPEIEGVWRVMAAEARLAHAPNPSTTIIDELWAHRDSGVYEAFSAAGAARRQPLVHILTTAGWDQNSFAYTMYDRGRVSKDRAFHYRWYAAPPKSKIDSVAGWRAANPSSWVTPAYLRKELRRARRAGNESEFNRWHRNLWSTGKAVAIPLELWDTCSKRPKIPPEAEVMVGVDTAPKRDSTGVVVDHKDAAGVHHWKVTIMRADETGYLNFDALEELLREIDRTYRVRRILVDPYAMTRSMLLLQEEGLALEEFPQSDARMVPASMNIYELLSERRLAHGGDPKLRAQVEGAAKQVTERGWRLKKRTSSVNIDALVAGAIAAYAWEITEEDAGPPQLFTFPRPSSRG
jgi:phage terminase large subunit-like protein